MPQEDEVTFCDDGLASGGGVGGSSGAAHRYTVYSVSRFVPSSCRQKWKAIAIVLLVLYVIIFTIVYAVNMGKVKEANYVALHSVHELNTKLHLVQSDEKDDKVNINSVKFVYKAVIQEMKQNMIQFAGMAGDFCPTVAADGLYYSSKYHTVLSCRHGNLMVVRRTNPFETKFDRSFAEYKHGFGDPSYEKIKPFRRGTFQNKPELYRNGEFFLGLETLHKITSSGNYTMQLLMAHYFPNLPFASKRYNTASYTDFKVGDESTNYTMTYSSQRLYNFGHNVKFHGNGSTFSTRDFGSQQNCSQLWRGGWWFRDCSEDLVFTSDCPNYLSYEDRAVIGWALGSASAPRGHLSEPCTRSFLRSPDSSFVVFIMQLTRGT